MSPIYSTEFSKIHGDLFRAVLFCKKNLAVLYPSKAFSTENCQSPDFLKCGLPFWTFKIGEDFKKLFRFIKKIIQFSYLVLWSFFISSLVFINWQKSKTILKFSLNSPVYWNTLSTYIFRVVFYLEISIFQRPCYLTCEFTNTNSQHSQNSLGVPSSFIRIACMCTQGRFQGGGGRTFAPPWDFEAKNVPNLINRMCFSISSWTIF